MITNTINDLVKAKIYEVYNNDERKREAITCMFNPSEYTISKSNQYTETPDQTADAPHSDIFKVGAKTLKLNLFFDTYEKGEDVSIKTERLWTFMERRTDSNEPKQVAFEWGVFKFTAYITNITQRITMFRHDGVPVRAKVDVSFTEYKKKPENQNPTSGGGPLERIWKVVSGNRLDLIAFNVYNDATQWRRIAEHNHLSNPLNLRPGQILRVPQE